MEGPPRPSLVTGWSRWARRRLRGAERSLRRDGPMAELCVGLFVFGIFRRLVYLCFPPGLTWDEHHFVINARNYINHAHDWNDHPPLGKLLMVPWILLLGDTSFAWRLSPALLGIASILIGGSLAA